MATVLPDGLPPSDQVSPDNEAIPEDHDDSEWESLDESTPEDTASIPPTEADDVEDEEPGTVTAQHTLDHLTGQQWPDFDTLIKDINNTAEALGFGLVKRRSTRRDPITGLPRRYDLVCVRGRPPATTSTGQRQNTRSRRGDCPFAARAVHLQENNSWSFMIDCPDHNHTMSSSAANIAVHRRRKRTQAVLDMISDLSSMPKNTSTDISDQVERQVPGIVLRAQDVVNERLKQKRRRLGLYTSTQHFLHKLQSDPTIVHKVHRENDDPGAPIDSIFWTYRWCIQKWKENSHILSVDNTYSVNKFNMPLFQVNGITEVHTTFNVAFCLLNGEREANFAWALRNLRALAVEESIPDPYVIMSDYDKAFKNAASSVFPEDVTKQQICRWHVIKNVVHNIKKKWNGQLEGTMIGESGGGPGSRFPCPEGESYDTDQPTLADGHLATQLLEPQDQADHMPTGESQHIMPSIQQPCSASRKYENNADGILFAWKAVVYASTEDDFWEAWHTLQKEFSDQQGT